MNIQLRPYAESDRAAIVSLMNDFGQHYVEVDPLKKLIRAPDYGEFFTDAMLSRVREGSGSALVAAAPEVIGFAAGVIETLSDADLRQFEPHTIGRLIELYVEPGSRRAGAARRLLEAFEAFFLEAGCDSVMIEVFAPDPVARGFYSALGYVDRDVQVMKSL